MTTNEIETAAIEAGAEIIDAQTGFGPMESRHIFTRAIRAYERAMWRPISEAPKDGTEVIIDRPDGGADMAINAGGEWWVFDESSGPIDVLRRATHFRPLPRREGE